MTVRRDRTSLPDDAGNAGSLITSEEFLHLDLPEHEKWELVRGELVLNPAPSYRHQKAAQKLTIIIGRWLEENPIGDLIQDWDVALLPDETRRPDLVFRLNDSPRMEIRTHGHGTPDLIIEVLSPGQAHRDLGDKKDLYERCGVTEYLVVDPDSRRVHHFTRADVGESQYVEQLVSLGRLDFRVLDGLSLNVEDLFAGLS